MAVQQNPVDYNITVSPDGRVFNVGISAFSNPETAFIPGTRFMQVGQFNPAPVINPAYGSLGAATVNTDFGIVGGAVPAGGFSKMVALGS